jgi:hypothetical protein
LAEHLYFNKKIITQFIIQYKERRLDYNMGI